jgi:hypothetical protein
MRVALGLVLVLTLAGCGGFRDSRLNPFNWFGRAAPAEPVAAAPAVQEDPRLLVDRITDMQVEPYSKGAIVRATAISPTQGYWDAELVELPVEEEGVLVFEFRIFPPITPADVNTPQSREVTAAASISSIKLDGVRRIVVQGANDARAVSR